MAPSSAILRRVIRQSWLKVGRRLFLLFCPLSLKRSHFWIGMQLCPVNFSPSYWPQDYAALLFGIHHRLPIPAPACGANGQFGGLSRVYIRPLCTTSPPTLWTKFPCFAPDQPFRLALWKKLLQSMSDPDAPFIDQLQDGVRLGVNNVIVPSPLWPLQDSTTSTDQELLQCESSWKSALDQPDVVWPRLEEECHEEFIEKVLGGLEALRSQHASVAVGKLGLVCADNRSPHLVMDSTAPGVTANTSIPNRMVLQRIMISFKHPLWYTHLATFWLLHWMLPKLIGV